MCKDGGEAEHAVAVPLASVKKQPMMTEDDLKKFVKFYVQARDEITPQPPRVPPPPWLLKEHPGYQPGFTGNSSTGSSCFV